MTHMENDWYGRGMFSFGDSSHTGYGHNGQTEGFAASLQYYAENKLSIAYCTNGEVYPKDFIMDKVFKICFNETVSIPTFKSVTIDNAKLQSYAGEYDDDNGLRVKCSLVDSTLVMEVKGQPFILEAVSDREFRNIPFGFFFDFDDTGKQLVVHDAATSYWLHKVN